MFLFGGCDEETLLMKNRGAPEGRRLAD